MMTRRVSMVAVGLVVASLAYAAETVKTTLAVKGMGCESCAAALKDQLKVIAGVVSYEVRLEGGEADVMYDPDKTDAATIAQSILKMGFQVTLPPWEPADASFMGCANGSCGARIPNARAARQPGATIGQRVYCPVSGVVLNVTESTLSAEVDGKPVYVCCEGCARYFEANRERVLALRGLRHGK